MKTKIIFILLLLLNIDIWAQQTSKYTQFYLKPFVYNPAFAGNLTRNLQVYTFYHNEMLGVRGAPENMYIGVDAAIKGYNMGWGISLTRDVVNILGRTAANLSYSYFLPLPKKQSLMFGISMGVVRNSIIFDDIVARDPAELVQIYNFKPAASFNADAGIVYTLNTFKFGVSALNLFNRKKFSDRYLLPYVQNPTFIITSMYDFEINDNLTAQPSVVITSSLGIQPQLDVNAILYWKNFLWGGFVYSVRSAVGATIGINYNDFKIGYSYQYATSVLSRVSSGVHEIFLAYNFSHFSGFSDVNKQNPNDFKLPPPPKNEYTQTNERYYNKKSRQKKRSNQNQNVVNNQKQDTVVHVIVFQDPEDVRYIQNVYKRDNASIQRAIEPYKVEIPEIDSTLENKENVKTTTKGKYYIVMSAFFNFEDAKKYQRIIQREANLSTRIFQSRNKKFYFVSPGEVNTVSEAKKQFREIQKLNIEKYIYGNLWLYKAD